MSVAFPEEWNGKSLKTSQDSRLTRVHYQRHNEQIDTLERRDLYILDFLSKFDALPIGSILPTTIPYESTDMPAGWIWADGKKYGKSENSYYEPKPKLWEKINGTNAVVNLTTFNRICQENGYSPYGGEPDDHTPFGLYVTPDDPTADYFWVPTLNDVFLMSITAGNKKGRTGGIYENDSIAEHTHDITSYPVNGANLNTNKEIGVALTDKITEDFQNHNGNYKSANRYTSLNNNSSGDETKPKSIAYYYMIKADMTNFDPANLVETDCASVSGYVPSIIPPVVKGNIAERIFPVPNPEDGKIDARWIDTKQVSDMVLEDAVESLNTTIGNIAVLRTDTLENWDDPSTTPMNKVPIANEEGKIDSKFLKTVTIEQIENLF